jgi:hypothetical protein
VQRYGEKKGVHRLVLESGETQFTILQVCIDNRLYVTHAIKSPESLPKS